MNSRNTTHPTYEELAKAWREGYAAGWKDQECDFPPHTTENPYKEQHMDNVNHPKHYEDGPFECIELTRLLSFDWGNVVKYCYRWQSKNGVEDLRKALWYANDAVIHGIPLYEATGLFDKRYVIFCHSLFGALVDTDWAGLKDLWRAFANNCSNKDILTAINNKINEIEKDGE